MSNIDKYPSLSISCRMVGPGGTTVGFYPQKDGKTIKAIWHCEGIPYGDYNEDTYEAEDGHNVETISVKEWNCVLDAMDRRQKEVQKILDKPKSKKRHKKS